MYKNRIDRYSVQDDCGQNSIRHDSGWSQDRADKKRSAYVCVNSD